MCEAILKSETFKSKLRKIKKERKLLNGCFVCIALCLNSRNTITSPPHILSINPVFLPVPAAEGRLGDFWCER